MRLKGSGYITALAVLVRSSTFNLHSAGSIVGFRPFSKSVCDKKTSYTFCVFDLPVQTDSLDDQRQLTSSLDTASVGSPMLDLL